MHRSQIKCYIYRFLGHILSIELTISPNLENILHTVLPILNHFRINHKSKNKQERKKANLLVKFSQAKTFTGEACRSLASFKTIYRQVSIEKCKLLKTGMGFETCRNQISLGSMLKFAPEVMFLMKSQISYIY